MRNKTKLFPFKQKLNKSDDESSAISKVDNDVKLKTQIFPFNQKHNTSSDSISHTNVENDVKI
jgi:hypothetical protein